MLKLEAIACPGEDRASTDTGGRYFSRAEVLSVRVAEKSSHRPPSLNNWWGRDLM